MSVSRSSAISSVVDAGTHQAQLGGHGLHCSSSATRPKKGMTLHSRGDHLKKTRLASLGALVNTESFAAPEFAQSRASDFVAQLFRRRRHRTSTFDTGRPLIRAVMGQVSARTKVATTAATTSPQPMNHQRTAGRERRSAPSR